MKRKFCYVTQLLLFSAIQARQMGGHGPKTMVITPSRFQWHKFKDMLHFYVMLGVIPIAGIVFYANVFIGPAQLTEAPTDRVPKHWEYHRVSHFFYRLCFFDLFSHFF